MTGPAAAQVHPAFAQAKVLAGLDPGALEEVASRFQPRRYARDAFLFHEDEPAVTYYIVGEGQVKILQTSAEGLEVILHVLGPGDMLGALPTLGEGTYPATAQAMTDVLAFAIAAREFEALMERHPRIAINLLRFAAGVIQAAHRRLREMATERVERRIARTLSRLAAQMGERTPEGIRINAPLSRQDLAEMTGTTLFTVSRTLKAWERQGLLRARREEVVILDPHGLIALAEDLPPRPKAS